MRKQEQEVEIYDLEIMCFDVELTVGGCVISNIGCQFDRT